MYETYDIRDVSQLQSDSQKLKLKNDRVVELVSEIKLLANKVSANWETEGSDLQSYLEEINKCTSILENSFIPAINEYANVLDNLFESTKLTQTQTVNDFRSQ